jgi:Ca-activated chloride channel family protein
MVLVPVSVTDRHGKTVNGLKAENFTIYDDQKPQTIVSFGGDDTPCSVGLILDISGSMQETLRATKEVAGAFLRASNPEDDFFLLTVSDKPETASGFTSDIEFLERSILSASPGGWTALVDTVYLGLNRMRKSTQPRRALFVLSDGMDNHSRYTTGELLRAAAEADIQIYTLLIHDPLPNRKPIETVAEWYGRHLLQDLSKRTGGVHFLVKTVAEAKEAAAKAAQMLRNEYVIGYKPGNSAPQGKWHKIRVQSDVPGASVYARNGYFGR